MIKFLKWLFRDALNITVMTRKWTVHYGDYYSGRSANFWFKYKAINFISYRHEDYISLINEITGEYIKIKGNTNDFS